ncbi:MAG: HAD family hydrolase [Candidatus Hadarchaeales archaeon]
MRVKAVLFDLDGVLVDSLDVWYRSMNETLSKFGRERVGKGEYLKRYWGFSLSKNFERLGLGREAVDYCLSRYEHHLEEIQPFPETREVLEELRRRRFKLALVTNTPSRMVQRLLSKLNLREFFHAVITGDDVRKAKPHPDAVRKACRQLEVPPEQAVLVGDTRSDVLAGRSAKVVVVGVGVEGDVRIENLRDLLLFLRTSGEEVLLP